MNEKAVRAAVHDPVKFQQHFLTRKLWEKQKEIARSIIYNPLTAVRGCHASGKTFLASGLPLWWLTRYTDGKVFTTAPTLRQVKLLWEEVALARRSSPYTTQLFPEPSTTGLRVNEGRYGLGASSSRGVNVQGFHSGNILIIADEAPGIEADIWDSIEGIRAGGNVRVLELGNPVIPSGHFYDAFTRSRAIYNCISISAFDTPNLQDELTGQSLTLESLDALSPERLDFVPFPSLITRRWVRERMHVWGTEHPSFISRVMAQFPSQSPYSVFALDWITNAKRDYPGEVKGRPVMQVGIDVAGPGDDETALCARVGGVIIRQEAWHEPDPRGAVCRVLGELRADRRFEFGPVVVDIIGIGYNFALHLADQGFNVHGFVAGAIPVQTGEPTLYSNLKAQAYFRLRELMKLGAVYGLDDLECEAQLSTILYRENSRGLVEIESKDAMRERGVKGSPDRAEAVVLAFAHVIPAHQHHESDRMRVSISPV